MTEIVSY